MELRHLRYFLAVAEELHFGHAADILAIAQPPLSQQIKSLEEELGVLLFTRTKRHVELTAAGAAFLTEVRKILAHVDQAMNIAQRASRGEIGKLEIGFVSSAVYGKVQSIFQLMRKRYPDISLVFQDLTSEEQVNAIKAYRLDVGIVRPPLIAAESLAMQVIRKDRWVVVLPQSHRLARQKKIPIEELAEESFLQVPRQVETGFYDQFIGICSRAGFSPKVVQEARSIQAIVSLIAGGMGVSIVPASLQSFRRTGVVYRPLDPQPPTTDLSVIWRPDDGTPALHSFLGIIWEIVNNKRPSSSMER